MINAAGEAFSVHRRFILKIALKVGDRKGGEDFTAAAIGEAGGAGGREVGETTAIDEAAGEGGGEEEVGGMSANLINAAVSVASCCCIGAMASLTASLIIVFNS